MGARGEPCPPNTFKLQESWPKVSHAARESHSIFHDLSFVVSNNS